MVDVIRSGGHFENSKICLPYSSVSQFHATSTSAGDAVYLEREHLQVTRSNAGAYTKCPNRRENWNAAAKTYVSLGTESAISKFAVPNSKALAQGIMAELKWSIKLTLETALDLAPGRTSCRTAPLHFKP